MQIDFWWKKPKSFCIKKYALKPFSWIFGALVSSRRFLYQKKIKKCFHFPVPVIVVGNITLGGTGKTPFVIWLVQELKKLGFKPGIVSRGVGGAQQKAPRSVEIISDVAKVGDEAVLLKRRTQCPVVVGIDRVAAVRQLLANNDCDVIVSDDGLQHYRLGRNIEIALLDGDRYLGNENLLPAGPLREPVKRLSEIDFVVIKMDPRLHGEDSRVARVQPQAEPGASVLAPAYASLQPGYITNRHCEGAQALTRSNLNLKAKARLPRLSASQARNDDLCRPALHARDPEKIINMILQGSVLINLNNETETKKLSDFQHKKVHAFAAIGNPKSFFLMLRNNGLELIEHTFPDHHLFQPSDLNCLDDLPIIMTEKDAVKCFNFKIPNAWFLQVHAQVDFSIKELKLECNK